MVANLFSSPLLCYGDKREWEASQAPTIRKEAASEGERPGLGSLALVLRFGGGGVSNNNACVRHKMAVPSQSSSESCQALAAKEEQE